MKIHNPSVGRRSGKAPRFFFRSIPIALITFLCLTPATDAAFSPAATQILEWADEQILEFRSELREIETSDHSKDTNASCLNVDDWRPQFLARLQLGETEAKNFFRLMTDKNACMKKDILEMDNRIGRLTDAVFRYKPHCMHPDTVDELNKQMQGIMVFIKQLTFIKNKLQEFGDMTKAEYSPQDIINDYEQQFVAEMPPALRSAALQLPHSAYKDDNQCPEPKSFFSFMQAKAEFQRLLDRIEELKLMGKDMMNVSSRFSSGKSYFNDTRLERIRRRARYRASAWFENNIARQLQQNFIIGGFSAEGSDVITKSPEEQFDQIDRNRSKIESKAPQAKTAAEVLKEEPIQPIKNVFRAVDQSEKNRAEVIEFNEETEKLYSQVKFLDRKLLDTLDRNPIQVMKVIDAGTEFYEEATDAVNDLCNSMPTCE